MLSLLARFRSLWRAIRRRDVLNDDMDAEFRLHMELRAEDLVRSGVTPAEAVRRARLEFGSTDSFKDRGREARGLRVFDGVRLSLLDVKLGGRMLVKHPGLTAIGTTAVAFAIAVGTATFTASNRSSFRRSRCRTATPSSCYETGISTECPCRPRVGTTRSGSATSRRSRT